MYIYIYTYICIYVYIYIYIWAYIRGVEGREAYNWDEKSLSDLMGL